MEAEINLFLQRFSGGFLDGLNLLLTNIGDEIFFLAVAMVLFWCVDKKFGFKLINVYLLGCIVMSGLKEAIKRPRPFEDGTVRSIGEKESGYSFPSGHSQSIANLSTQAAIKTKKAWVTAVGALLTLVVMATRLYLGQHYISDVIAGCALGVAAAAGFGALYELLSAHDDKFWYVITPLCVAVAVICAAVGVENEQIYDVCGGYGAAVAGYALEKKFISLDTGADLWKQIVKIVLGAAAVLLVKEGLKAVFAATGADFPLVYNFLRYAAVALTAFVLMPWIFKKLRLYGKKRTKNDQEEQKEGIKNESID